MYEYVAFCGVQIFRTTNTFNAGTNASNCTEIATTNTMCYNQCFLILNLLKSNIINFKNKKKWKQNTY